MNTRGRRWFLAITLAALLGIVVAAESFRDAPDAPPNVLVVVVDTLRADRTTLDGYKRPTTPHVERFARDATTFSRAWSSASWTFPAHAGLLTGVAPHRLDLFRGSFDAKLRDGTTLAESLGGAGFDTGLFSGNPWVGPQTGLTRGFGTVQHMTRGDATFPSADDVLGRMLSWIRDRGAARRPWFAFANLMDVHAPYAPPPEESARFLRKGLSSSSVESARTMLSTTGLLEASLGLRTLPRDVDAAMSDLYDGEIATVDAAIGRLLDALRADGSLDGTLVVLTSDHGEGLGDHGWREHGLRLHRELLHVPLVVRLPGRFEGGRTVDTLVRLEDVTPTVLACCGIAPADGLDGRDLDAAPTGRRAFASNRPYAGWPWLADADLPAGARAALEVQRYSVFDDRYHAIVEAGGKVEMYDVRSDPRELHNLAGQAPAELARLRTELEREFGVEISPR